MGHHHEHSHSHAHTENKQALFFSFVLITAFMIVEVAGGLLTNSLALLSDAGHMFSDAASLGLSLFALRLGEKKVNKSQTFGYKRFEIIAAALNGLMLIVVAVYIFVEAVRRFFAPPEVQSGGMLLISVIGLIVNISAAMVLMKGNKGENLNVKSAFLHVLGDLLGSVGAIVAALLIFFLGWNLADPIASVIVGVIITSGGVRVLKEAFHILMEGAPEHMDVQKVKEALSGLPMVLEVHDLHVWTITSGYPVLSCHLTIDNEASPDDVLSQSQRILHDQFDIEHSTIQVEKIANGCPSHFVCN